MSYKTSGTVSSVKWTKAGTNGAGNPSKDTLTFRIEPVSPYAFEQKNGDKMERYVLWENGMNLSKISASTEYEAVLGNPPMSFDTLLLLKQNRTKIVLEISAPTGSPITIESLSVLN